ncbi:hypothetical protein GCM10010464_19630 [Pseudonocardia yunnanensis]|uniref:Uncharacterized protein n=1 Tax=Pseudonocardia yunnanensis TaxID=58107 RepID=A0ABW4ETM8_9PSEU
MSGCRKASDQEARQARRPLALPSLASGFLLPLSGGRHRVVVVGEERQRLGRDAPVTADEMQRALTATHGPESRWDGCSGPRG